MLDQLAKLASMSLALRKDIFEKRAIIGAIGSMTGSLASKAARTAVRHPAAAITGTALAVGIPGTYKKNMSTFREAAGQLPQQSEVR